MSIEKLHHPLKVRRTLIRFIGLHRDQEVSPTGTSLAARPGGAPTGKIETGKALLLRGLGSRSPSKGDNYRNGFMKHPRLSIPYARKKVLFFYFPKGT